MAMPPTIPVVKTEDPPLLDWLRRFSVWADKEIKGRLPYQTAVDHVLLLSPGGKVWKVSVSDTGTVVTTAVPLGSHPQ